MAMALAFPESEFVGVDLSPKQIATAHHTAHALGLTNVRGRFNGIDAFTFIAWDQTVGTIGSTATTAGAGTGTSAFSGTSASAQVTVLTTPG